MMLDSGSMSSAQSTVNVPVLTKVPSVRTKTRPLSGWDSR